MAAIFVSVRKGKLKTTINRMQINREQLDELTSVIEDTIQYACDKEQLSGETAWTVVECLATAKLAELRGELAAS